VLPSASRMFGGGMHPLSRVGLGHTNAERHEGRIVSGVLSGDARNSTVYSTRSSLQVVVQCAGTRLRIALRRLAASVKPCPQPPAGTAPAVVAVVETCQHKATLVVFLGRSGRESVRRGALPARRIDTRIWPFRR